VAISCAFGDQYLPARQSARRGWQRGTIEFRWIHCFLSGATAKALTQLPDNRPEGHRKAGLRVRARDANGIAGVNGQTRIPAYSGRDLDEWWSWGDSNPRPQAFAAQIYMFSGLI